MPLRRKPDAGAGFETEALFGETVTVYDEAEGWAWVQLERDGYVGYVPADALAAEVRDADASRQGARHISSIRRPTSSRRR